VVDALVDIGNAISSGEHERASNPYLSGGFTMLPSSSTTLTRRGQRLWLLALGVLLASVATGFYLVGLRSAGVSPVGTDGQSVSVLLLDFDSQLTLDDMLGSSLQTALKVGLEQARFVNLMPRQTVEDALGRMQVDRSAKIDRELGIDIGKVLGIPRLVEGQIVKIGSTYKLGVSLIEPASGESVFTETATARSEDDLIPELDKLVMKLRQGLGEIISESDEILKPLEKVTTRNLRALEAYSQGIARFDAQDEEAAVPYFQRAIELDPEFAMAYAKLGTTYRNLQESTELVDRQFEEALLHTDRLTEVEQLYVQGWRAMSHGTPDEIIERWQKMSSLYPRETAGHHNLGASLRSYRNDFEAAAAAFQLSASTGVRGRRLDALGERALCFLALERVSEAQTLFSEVKELAEELGVSMYYSWEMVGDYGQPEAHFQALLDASETNGRPLSLLRLSVYQASRGRLDEALSLGHGVLAQHIESPWLNNVIRLSSVSYLQWQGRVDDAGLALDELLSIAHASLEGLKPDALINANKPAVTFTAIVGKLAARMGRLKEAKRLLSKIDGLGVMDDGGIWAAYGLMLEGEILLREDSFPAALARLGESLVVLESIQIQESLAYANAMAGNKEQAIIHYEWLTARRGRGYVECTEFCFDWALNIASWPMFHYQAASLYEQAGNTKRAKELYKIFLEHWGVQGSANGTVGLGGVQPGDNVFVEKARRGLVAE
jgi:tetratricopeptide (TPR) repeat protein